MAYTVVHARGGTPINAARTVKLNSDTNLLKLIAIISMLIDHMGSQLFPQYPVMRQIGRLAFPIFAYCIAVGCIYTRSIWKYALRVGVMAILVQPLYAATMGHALSGAFDWAQGFYRPDLILEHYYSGKLNILFSLCAGILLIWTIRDKKYIATAALIAFLFMFEKRLDYGINGIILMVLFFAFVDRPLISLTWVGLFMLYMGAPSLFTQMRPYFGTQIYALLALPLIYIPMKTGLRLNKYVFYIFYPAHLALIFFLKIYL